MSVLTIEPLRPWTQGSLSDWSVRSGSCAPTSDKINPRHVPAAVKQLDNASHIARARSTAGFAAAREFEDSLLFRFSTSWAKLGKGMHPARERVSLTLQCVRQRMHLLSHNTFRGTEI